MAIDLTDADRIKRRARITDTSLDPLIAEIIDEVSETFEYVMARHTLFLSRIEIYELPRFKRLISLRGAPATLITEIKHATTRDFDAVTAMDVTLYDTDLEAGYIRLQLSSPYRPAYIQVTYDGGMATDTAAFIIAFPQIAAAADRECVERLNKSRHPTGAPSLRATTRGTGGGTATLQRDDWDLMPSTQRILTAYRKRII